MTRNPETESGTCTAGELLAWAGTRFEHLRPTAGREAVLLLKTTLGLDEATLRAHLDQPVNAADVADFRERVSRRAAGEPAAYVLGWREFYGRSFRVDPRVLIPRPETELLVELTLGLSLDSPRRILELGTGSGCLAVTLAAELEAARVVAVDRSLAALSCASANADRLGVRERVRFLASDWTSGLDLAAFDLVIANPPYLTEDEWSRANEGIRDWEPSSALVAGSDGLDSYRRLARMLTGLATGVPVLLEIGASQADEVSGLFAPLLRDVAIHCDLAGLDRAVVGIRHGSHGNPG